MFREFPDTNTKKEVGGKEKRSGVVKEKGGKTGKPGTKNKKINANKGGLGVPHRRYNPNFKKNGLVVERDWGRWKKVGEFPETRTRRKIKFS